MKHDQASRTAKFVSNGIYWVSRQPGLSVEVPPPLRRATEAMTWQINPRLRSGNGKLQQALLLKRCQLLQAASVPGIYLYQVLRKRCIEALARTVVGGGVGQMVVIGGGFDTLSLRLSADLPGLSVIELDHPATQAVKREAVRRSRLPHGHCSFFPVDLSGQSLQSALAACPGYRADQPALLIAEGLTMYLTEPRIREMLECLATQATGSKFIFTYMEQRAAGRFDFQDQRLAASLWLGFQHERFTWGIPGQELPAFLAASGLRLLENKTHHDLRQEYLTEKNRAARLAVGENIALAGGDDRPTPP